MATINYCASNDCTLLPPIVGASSQSQGIAAAVCSPSASLLIGRYIHIQYTSQVHVITVLSSNANTTPILAKLSVLQTGCGRKIHIIKRLAPYWRGLGILLVFDESGTQLDIIEKKAPQ